MTPRLIPAYTTRLGRAYHGDALDVLRRLPADSVALVMTSPPFALRRQKAYGNVAATEYVEWFWPFAREIYRVLRPDGSFVLDLGGAWNRGSGTRSLYQYQLVLRLCEVFHLAQGIAVPQGKEAEHQPRRRQPPRVLHGRSSRAGDSPRSLC